MSKKQPKIELEPDGFSVVNRRAVAWTIQWNQVVRVIAFKLDRISYDTICFGFQRLGESAWLWCIEEDWDGYKAVVPGIEQLTQGGWPEKFAQVAKPAFEFNWTVIWEQNDAQALADDPILIWLAPPENADPIG